MNVGTKSLLIGAHQFLWHPIVVLLAWHELYGWPNWKELVCIVIHDWGYWGLPDVDGEEGIWHPDRAAWIANRWLDGYTGVISDGDYGTLCLHHSRYIANINGKQPSKLCWADKLSVKFDPWWLYLPRVVLSGEIHEYRKRAAEFGEIPLSASHVEWYKWAQARMIKKAYNRDIRPSYTVGS
jgi:hypothetical protein